MRDLLCLKPSENILYIQCIHSVTPVSPLKRGKNTKLPYHPPPTIQNPLRPPSQGDRKQKSLSWMWFRIFLLLSCSPLLRGLGGVVSIYKHYPEEFHFRICKSRRRRWTYSFSLQTKKEAYMLLFCLRIHYTSWCSTTPFEYPTHPVDASVSCQEIALTGQAAIASLTSSSRYSTPSFTRESHSSSIRKTSPAITAHELHPIHVEFTWGFLMIPLRAWSFDWSIIRQ